LSALQYFPTRRSSDLKIFLATADAALVALDARTGQVVWEQQVGDWTVGQHYSGGPMVVKGKVIAGMSGCYYINTRCFVTAHDPEDRKSTRLNSSHVKI